MTTAAANTLKARLLMLAYHWEFEWARLDANRCGKALFALTGEVFVRGAKGLDFIKVPA